MSTKRRKRHSPERSFASCVTPTQCSTPTRTWRRCSGAGGQRIELPAVEEPVRQDEGRRGRAAEEAGGREPAAQATGSREGAEHPDAPILTIRFAETPQIWGLASPRASAMCATCTSWQPARSTLASSQCRGSPMAPPRWPPYCPWSVAALYAGL